MPENKIDLFPISMKFQTNSFPWVQSENEVLDFKTPWDLIRYFSDKDSDDNGRYQTYIDQELKRHSEVRNWHRKRTKFSKLPHFSKYKGAAYDVYHSAARKVYSGAASVEEKRLFDGLRDEIEDHGLLAPVGQTVFHGRADDNLSTQVPYASFVSTSLDPVVAVLSAVRRHCALPEKSQKYVYLLHLLQEIPVLWGHWRNVPEWELLLPPGLVFEVLRKHSGPNFAIIEATVARVWTHNQ
ncbi:hypothetical protein K3720_00515 [Leisingera caerulea]|uniref:hypothetical protein n=1 Tax=Leisingera caerulea TaxID=506591 RepID=UPI0021A2E99E|nr:hypothetical protein [Leisingera caerulea]UWQ49925.1 hypothetical protein K3720_00515 [Leisingera caerulea]